MLSHSLSTGIGIIGCGRAGMIHARNFARLVPRAHVAAVADASEESRVAAALELGGVPAFADWRALLEHADVQGVVIAAPTALHREIAVPTTAEFLSLARKRLGVIRKPTHPLGLHIHTAFLGETPMLKRRRGHVERIFARPPIRGLGELDLILTERFAVRLGGVGAVG